MGRIQDTFINHLEQLVNTTSYEDLVKVCVEILSIQFKWYRHSEVNGAPFNSMFSSLFTNKNDSRPLGGRIVYVIKNSIGKVCVPDG
jgi:glutathione peroxidase-family protein